MSLKLTNKTINTFRLTLGAYAANLTGVAMRYENLADRSKSRITTKVGRERATYIAWSMMVDTVDLKVGDRVFVVEDNKTLVVASFRTAGDQQLDHYEVLLREIESDFHADITWKTLDTTQTNYDPIFKQWGASKNYTDTTISVLVDSLKDDIFIELQKAGRIDNSNLVITVDLPNIPSTRDKFEIDGEEFFINRIEKLPYQTICVVGKVLPEGKQFS